MDTEPDHQVEDNANTGKRKRSSNTGSSSPHPSITREPSQDVQNAIRKGGLRATLKRARVGTGTPDLATHSLEEPSLAARAGAFPLPPFPVEIVQHIMSYLDPFSLGRLMRVNRCLRGLLDSHSEPAKSLESETNLPFLTPEHIWSCSRKAHLPGMPHPLHSVSELEMFRLIYGRRCQICSTSPPTQSTRLTTTPWNSGPGPTGVRTVWPFKVKVCANCLKPKLLKDTDLSTLADAELQKGLLSALFTPSLHYVMSITVTQVPIPSGLKLEEYFYQPHVEDLLHRAPSTKDPTYQAWFRQLDALRQQALTDTVRLEAWEASQNVNHDLLAVPPNIKSRSSASGSSVYSDNLTRSYFTTSTGGGRPALSSRTGLGTSSMSGPLMRPSMVPQTPSQRLTLTPPTQSYFSVPASVQIFPPPDASTDQFRHPPERGSLDILRLKAEKRAEIERRCLALDPPINPSVLDHCSAFVSALQVPLDEASWQKLKSQLLSQQHRAGALESTEQDTTSQMDYVDNTSVWRAATPLMEPPEVDLFKQALRPVREKLYDFAREYVHRRYANGTGLTYDSAPQFAADVLIYVRQRFYDNLDQEDAAFYAEGKQPPEEGASGIRTRTLRLEHMRYVFESSIKPYTEFVRKELFLCSQCDTQGRHFAFEAIIQHFASKHTDAFSRGNAVVHWKAEWPLQPPFESNPGRNLETFTSASHIQSISHLPPTLEAPQQNDFLPSALIRESRETQARNRPDYPMSHTLSHQDLRHRALYTETPIERRFDSSNLFQPADTYYKQSPYPSSDTTLPAQRDSPGSFAYPTTYVLRRNEDYERSYADRNRLDTHREANLIASLSEPGFPRTYHSGGEQTVPTPGYWQHGMSADYRPANKESTATARTNVTEGIHANRVSTHNEYRPSEIAPRIPEGHGSSQPRSLASGHREYDSPRDQSRGSSATFPRGMTSHEQVYRRPSEAPWHDDADVFLRSIDPREARDKVGSTPTSRFSQAPETQLESHDAYENRKFNTFQPREHFQSSSSFYQDQSPDHMIYSPELPAHWDREHQRPIATTYRTPESAHRSSSPFERLSQDGARYAARATDRQVDFNTRRIPPLHQLESRNVHTFPPLSGHAYRQGRAREPPELEARYVEASRHNELRPEGVYHYHDVPYYESQAQRHYEREGPIWDPRAGRYYVERPVREYISEPAYVTYEEISPREAARPAHASYYREDVQRPPTGDHERRGGL